ncbi:hypothetical protein EIN_155370 [Entamoeba invadens IP1]|uniref:Ras-GAP domain-containing protein n=1 Tax=Entamoeba invadens IP1 TaxID=370355 RepID=A0A0A1U927_ENTIV|nr:hypothetical protein EIN_155370 [Entamoeba invadens IP1]ELP91430.1 hypothetical protein EIN_155370 [Entamoeba invadens IP1]|eukprot:XP_004258201.1 hypothetical protein EIN_155370 [Entamoeba invadens IP1]
MSDVSDDRNPSKSDFDKLLFSRRHNLLEAVVRTLVTQQRQNRSVEYARLISDYFKVHGRFMELLMWAIDIDFLTTDTLTIDSSSFQHSTFFIPFYNQFVHYHFKNYLLDIFEPIIFGLSSGGDYSEEFKIAMNFQSKEITTAEDIASYQASLDKIAQIFCALNEDFIKNAEYLPDFVRMFFTKFFKIMREGEVETVVIEKIFNELFFTYTICQNVNDPFMLMFDDDRRPQLVPVLYKLEFVSLIIQNIYTNTSMCEGFLIDLQQTIKKMNGNCVGEKMFKYVDAHPVEYKEEPESEEEMNKAFEKLLDAIKNNIQGILDLLPGNLSNQLLDAIKLEKYVYDDYQIYHATLDTINTFTQAYNAKINKLDAENMALKGEYDRLFKEQQELIQQLDTLERKLGPDELEKLSSCIDDELMLSDDYPTRETERNGSIGSRDSLPSSKKSGMRPIGVFQDTSPSLTPKMSSSQKNSPKQSKLFSKFHKGDKDKKEKEKEKDEKKKEKDEKKKEKKEKKK